MPQAASILSFPVDPVPSGFLYEVSGGDSVRLNAIAGRLYGAAAILYYMTTSNDLDLVTRNALCGIEQIIQDCITVVELQPVGARP